MVFVVIVYLEGDCVEFFDFVSRGDLNNVGFFVSWCSLGTVHK
jgi:hypothetical protein